MHRKSIIQMKRKGFKPWATEMASRIRFTYLRQGVSYTHSEHGTEEAH